MDRKTWKQPLALVECQLAALVEGQLAARAETLVEGQLVALGQEAA